jgi:hypothetical protein
MQCLLQSTALFLDGCFPLFFQTVLCASSPNPAILPSFLQNCVLDFPAQKNKNQLIGWALNSIRPITVTNPMPCSRCGPVRREEPARKKPPPATFLSTGHGAAWSEHQEPAAECPSLPRRLSLRVRRRPRVPISQRAGADHLVGQVSLLTSPEGGALFLLLSDGPFRRRQCARTPAVR